jgi:hypothetical protein
MKSLNIRETQGRKIANDIVNVYDGIYFRDLTETKTGLEPNKELKRAVKKYQENKKVIEVTSEISSLEDVAKRCNIDTSIWDISKYAIEQGANDKEGNAQFRWKLNLEKKISNLDEKIIEDLKNDLKKESKIVKRKSYEKNNKFMLEIAIFDLHFSKLSYAPECGANYDMKIARKVFFDTLYDLVNKGVKHGIPEKILFVVGKDFFNIDNNKLTTTAGTPQDVDGRFAKMIKEGRQMLTDAIDYLKDLAPVDVVISPGNHDQSTMIHVGDSLECYYHNDQNITVDNQPISRKYVRYGKTLICFDHGDKTKPEQMPIIMATERPSDWAATRYKENHRGHKHSELTTEIKGVKIRNLSSVTAPDLYHFDNGYVGNVRQAQGFVFDKENGLEAVIYSKPVE